MRTSPIEAIVLLPSSSLKRDSEELGASKPSEAQEIEVHRFHPFSIFGL